MEREQSAHKGEAEPGSTITMKSLKQLAFALLAAGIAWPIPATAQTAPPPLQPDRTAEDYSFLADPSRRGDWSDTYKYIPVDGGGGAFLSLGSEVRERFEMFSIPRFGLGTDADSYLLQRVMVHADLRMGRAIRLFAQLGAHDAFGKKLLNPPDEDHIDVQQLFVEVRPVQELTARVGRQELAFNPLQRFVSFRDGTNVRQNFDGGRVTYRSGPLRVEAFLTSPVTLRRDVFDNSRDRDQLFGGLYASHTLGPNGRSSLEGYWYRLERDNFRAGPLVGTDRRDSFGIRFAGAAGRFDWDAEAVLQRGRSIGRKVRAWAGSLDAGYSIKTAPLQPRLGLRFDAGSGDRDPNDTIVGGFHPLFPSGPYFNEANLTSWTNLVAIRPSIRIQPERRLTLTATAQMKWREEAGDAVYLGPSAPLPGTAGNREREIGQVYTVDAMFQLNRNLGLRAYYLHHSAGDAIAAAGGEAVDFVMSSATLRF